ncbi:MAG: hypothetical protein ACMUIP_03715 [bacterium]
MKKYGSGIIVSLIIIAFISILFMPVRASAQFLLPLPPPPLYLAPPVYPPILPPAPVLFPRAANQLTATVALPAPALATAALPLAPAPIISTSQLFLGLLLRIGEESGLFATNPALFWYLVGILY